MAAKVKELGFAGECGYNQLLYPIENQSRVLISWLVHRLPRGQDLRKEDDRNPAVVLNALITKAVIDWKSQGWHHPNCYYGVPPRNAYNIAPFQTLRMHSSKQSILDIFKESAELGISAEGSILEKHSLERIEESRHSSFLEGRLKSDFSDCAVTMKSTRLLANKHDCSRKSMIESAFCKYRLGNVAECSVSALEQAKLSIKIQLERSSCISAAIKALDLGDHEAEIARLEEEERAARVEVAALEEKFRATSGTLSLLESIASDLTSKMEFLEGDLSGASAESSELERKILVKRKTLEMIPFAHDNILKLEDDCAASIARATERTAEWDEERAALERKIQLKRSEKEKVPESAL